MSVPKYIKEVSKFEKKLKWIFLTMVLITLITWIVHVGLKSPSNPVLILIFPEFYVFVGALFAFGYFYLKSWKEKVAKIETDIFETITYREKTSLKNLARVKKIKKSTVESIVQRLIDQERLYGVIKDGLYIAEKIMAPICSLCNNEIDDKLLLVLCPYCKRPFHKDHIIDYINEIEKKCPNPSCKHPLDLADIFK